MPAIPPTPSGDAADRRPSSSAGGRPGRFVVPLVVLTAIVVIAAVAFIRLDPGSALGRISTVTRLDRLASAPAADGTDGVSRASTGDQVAFLRFVVDDIQRAWTEQFAAAGLTYEPTRLVLFDRTVRSGCGTTDADVGPFYCPVDEDVYLEVGFFEELANDFGAPGDFAEAYVVAHEFGHHVQTLLGITADVGALEAADPTIANDLSVRTELQADCLAGIWGHTAYEQSRLEPGDLDEAVTAAAAVGDDRLQAAATGSIDPDTFTHGTSEQRVAWFLAGFETGKPAICDSFQRDLPLPATALATHP